MQNRSTTLVQTFQKGSLIAVILTAVLISLMLSYLEFHNFSKRANLIESEYITSKKTLIKQDVLIVTQHIERVRITTRKKIKERIKKKTFEAHNIATSIYNKFNGKLPDKKIKQLIVEALRPMRFFNGAGYYFIHSLDGILQLHSIHPKKEGSNRLNTKSSAGQYIVKDLFSIIKKSGEGFLEYQYPEINNNKKEKSKFTFVKHFKPYNWSIGTGDYLENIEQEMQKEILEYISHIKLGDNGYIFVVNYDGIILMNSAQKHLIGFDMSNLVDPNGVNVFKEERKAVKNPDGDFIYYVWNKPSSLSPSPKMTFMKGIPDWRWMVGTGLYIDDAEITVSQQKDILKNELINKISFIIFLVIIITILVIYYSNKLAELFTKEISQFSGFFTSTLDEEKIIDVNLLRFSEFKELANSANKMLDDKINAEKSLLTSEQDLSIAQRITHFGTWKLDVKNNDLRWSDEVYKIFGISPQEYTPTYESFLSYIHPDDKHLVDEEYHLSIKNKTPYDVEHRIILKDGKVKHVREYAETQYNEKGEAVSTSGTIQDITTLKEKEEQLRRTQKMDALGKLTGGIAHDYNNMMGIVLGYSELLLSHLTGKEKALGYLAQIRTAGERARDLTTKLLTFSSYKTSETEETNINEELLHQQKLLEKTLTARITLQFDLEKELWPTKLDKGDLNDAIINMIINASHAIDENGTVTITTRNINIGQNESLTLGIKRGNYISLSLADSGEGMDSQTASKIFDPFFSTKGNNGTGLGLSQVYGFATRSDGAIKVISELNQGTEFILYFPQYIAITPTKEKESVTTHSFSQRAHETILVVDDEELLCEMASEILSDQGYHVIKAYSAIEALKILKTETVDIVFSDIIMPDITGFELAKEIQKKYPNIIVQLTSGFNDEQKLNLNIEFSSVNILPKPYSKKDLLDRIHGILVKP